MNDVIEEPTEFFKIIFMPSLPDKFKNDENSVVVAIRGDRPENVFTLRTRTIPIGNSLKM